MSDIRNGSKGEFEPGLTRLQVRHSTTEINDIGYSLEDRSGVMFTDMPPGTDCPYPIRILAFFEMIRPYHVVIRI